VEDLEKEGYADFRNSLKHRRINRQKRAAIVGKETFQVAKLPLPRLFIV
jgi:hypothetical protein